MATGVRMLEAQLIRTKKLEDVPVDPNAQRGQKTRDMSVTSMTEQGVNKTLIFVDEVGKNSNIVCFT